MVVRKRLHHFGNEVRHQIGLLRCVAALAIILAAGLVPVIVFAAECPALHAAPSIPPPDSIITPDKPKKDGHFNIDTYKRQLTKYHDEGAYNKDIVAVMEKATRYVLDRASDVKRPAVVLDIDETSLSNWENIKVDDYGFIEDGPCPLQAKKACGFNEWIDMAIAPAIEPTLKFFNAIRAKKDAISDRSSPTLRYSLSPAAARSSGGQRCGISIAPDSRAGRGSRPAPTRSMARSYRSRAGNATRSSQKATPSLPISATRTAT
jgi:hypothetical protein